MKYKDTDLKEKTETQGSFVRALGQYHSHFKYIASGLCIQRQEEKQKTSLFQDQGKKYKQV